MDVINVQPILDEVSKVLGKVKDYFSSLYLFLDNPASNPPSYEEEVMPDLTYADSLGVATSTRYLSANKASGYIVDAANVTAALDREAAIRIKSKASYYEDSARETGAEIMVYENLAAEYKAGITGNISSI